MLRRGGSAGDVALLGERLGRLGLLGPAALDDGRGRRSPPALRCGACKECEGPAPLLEVAIIGRLGNDVALTRDDEWWEAKAGRTASWGLMTSVVSESLLRVERLRGDGMVVGPVAEGV